MSELPWFRMYSEFMVDPLVQMLSFEDQRHFVMALCMKCKGMLDKTYPSAEFRGRVIATTLGLDQLNAAEANRRLREHGLVDENWQPIAWERRQFRSDHDGAERQRRSRERRRLELQGVTGMSRDSHCLDSDAEAEAEADPEGEGARAALDVPREALGGRSVTTPSGSDGRSVTTSAAHQDPLEAWREVAGTDARAMSDWIRHCEHELQPAKLLGGMARIAIAKMLAGWGEPEEQRRAVETAIGNGWRSLRPADGGKATTQRRGGGIPATSADRVTWRPEAD